CRSIDVALSAAGTGKLVDQLVKEINAEASDLVVAYRGNHRWTPTVEALELDGEDGDEPRLREQGVYLITGGLEEQGLPFAEHLARQARAKLVLVEPASLPDRGEWEQWLLPDADRSIDSQAQYVEDPGPDRRMNLDMEQEQDYIRLREQE